MALTAIVTKPLCSDRLPVTPTRSLPAPDVEVDRSRLIVAPLASESEDAVNVPTEPGNGLGPGESVAPLFSVTLPLK